MKYIVGIDEVGRGPLAGPVTVGIVMCEENLYKKLKRDKRLPKSGKDSKKLSPEEREKYAWILSNLKKPFEIVEKEGALRNSELRRAPSFSFSVVHISNREIDKIGISKCIKKAMQKGLEKLVGKRPKNDIKILLDGSLKAPLEFKNQKTIIKGDEKEKIIAWASILAKVSRDSLMRKVSKKYPHYGFEKHKGYGTLSHRMAIKKHGLSDFHRKSFTHV